MSAASRHVYRGESVRGRAWFVAHHRRYCCTLVCALQLRALEAQTLGRPSWLPIHRTAEMALVPPPPAPAMPPISQTRRPLVHHRGRGFKRRRRVRRPRDGARSVRPEPGRFGKKPNKIYRFPADRVSNCTADVVCICGVFCLQ